jgi:hypothetical protein
MKALKPSLLFLCIAMILFSCKTQTNENQTSESVASNDVQVYYFHNTKRCATCNAVENETRVALEMFYKDQMTAGTMEFTSLNLEEDQGKEMAQSLRVSGQTLLITKGDTHVNLTNEGFMNARTNPTKFHEILKAQIDKLL